MVLLLHQIRGTRVGGDVVEQGVERVLEPLLENAAGLRIEFAVQTPHAGLVIDPGAQASVAPLPLEQRNAVANLCPPDLVPQLSAELGGRCPRGNLCEELAAV